jgi:hypothetical protein
MEKQVNEIESVEYWRQRASRLRWVLVEISLGCADPQKAAHEALEREREVSSAALAKAVRL